MDEVIKLAHINCPLRIVIGYVHIEETADMTLQKHTKLLDGVASVLNGTDAWKTVIAAKKSCTELQNDLLIILGDSNVQESGRCRYTPYLYNFATGKFDRGGL